MSRLAPLVILTEPTAMMVTLVEGRISTMTPLVTPAGNPTVRVNATFDPKKRSVTAEYSALTATPGVRAAGAAA